MSAAAAVAPPCAPLLAACFGALSMLGGDVEHLEEDAVLRLVERARTGDHAARQRLYRQCVGRVFRMVRGLLRCDAEAEDVTQDAMLTALTSLERYSPRSGTRFIAWVTTIAVNTTRCRFRRWRPELTQTGELPDMAGADTDVGDDIDRAQRRAALLTALAELTASERELVSLRYGAELNATEIAVLVGKDAANVRKLLERVRTRLGERIETLLRLRGAQ